MTAEEEKKQKEQRVRILKACKSGGAGIPTESFLNYIKSRVVTFDEIKMAGLNDDKVKAIELGLKNAEEDLWQDALQQDTCEAYRQYISESQLGSHTIEALEIISRFDDSKWNEAYNTLTEESLSEYLDNFPTGAHVVECRNLLEDLPWLETKRKNTIEGYSTYIHKYPGKHDAEAQSAIHDIKDDNEWANTCILNTTSAYRDYVNKFPHGKHLTEAQNRLNSGAAGEYFLNALRDDPNAYSASEIKRQAANHVISWNDVDDIFGFEKRRAIEDFDRADELVNKNGPDDLQPNSTEVYFWGTPGSGKTCALGTIISTAKRNGILEVKPSSGRDYLYRLSNLFVRDGICKLPGSTPLTTIPEMIIHLTEKKGNQRKQHRLTLVDLAGELFNSVYYSENDLSMTNEQQQIVDKAMSYLKDQRNEKIHFFVVEYGAHNKTWEGLSMTDYLDTMVQFLKTNKVFSKSTVGVYVLVTKCDKMDCQKEERPRVAYEYVQDELSSFWNTLEQTCKQAGISDIKTLSFSIGDVFAQNLCVYDGTDTNKVIDKLITKTPTIGGIFDWLKK